MSDYSVLGAEDDSESVGSISEIQRNLFHEFDDGHKDHLEVFLRIKPVTKDATEQENDQKYLDVESDEAVVVHPLREAVAPPPSFAGGGMGCAGPRTRQHGMGGAPRLQNVGSFPSGHQQSLKFTFSRVFDETTNQKFFFDEAVQSTVREFLDGQNCLLFAYGVTNSGKTHTMQGTPSDAGVVPRTFDVIFNSVGDRLYGKSDLKPSRFCDVELLDEEAESREMSLKESILRQIYVQPKKQISINFSSNSSSDISKSMLSCSSTADDSNASKTGQGNLIDEEISTIVANRRREQASVAVKGANRVRFSVWASFAEVYNEQVYDLLVPPPEETRLRRLKNGTATGTYRPSNYQSRTTAAGQSRNVRAKCPSPPHNGRKERVSLQMKEDVQGRPYINGLREVSVTSADEAFKLLTLGRRNLQMAYTKLNESSSRSHCIFTLKLMRVLESKNGTEIKHTKFNILSLCDLAGIERSCKTQNVGERVKEAGNINNSLFTLGRCIQAIRHNQVSQASDRQLLPPFRDSKLTRLFQPFLIGKGRAKMVVTVNQCRSMYPENLNAIKFSAIAKQLCMVPAQVIPINISQPTTNPQLPKKLDPRKTIEWASASEVRKHKALPIFGKMHAEEKEDDDDDEEEEEEENESSEITIEGEDDSSSDGDDGSDDSQMEKDDCKIKRLEEENVELRKENLCLEGRIEKMTRETEILVKNLHTKYEELIERAELRHEEAMDKKVDLITHAYERALKRRRCDDDDDDRRNVETRETMKARIRDLEEELHTCNQQLTNWKQNYDVSVREVRSLTQEVTEVKFQAAAERMQLAERSSTIEMESLELKAEVERLREQIVIADTRNEIEVTDREQTISRLEGVTKSLSSDLETQRLLASSNQVELEKARSQNLELLVRIKHLEMTSIQSSDNLKPVLCDRSLGLGDTRTEFDLDLSCLLANSSISNKPVDTINEMNDIENDETAPNERNDDDDDASTISSDIDDESTSTGNDTELSTEDKDLFSDSLNLVCEKVSADPSKEDSSTDDNLLKSAKGSDDACDAREGRDNDATVDYHGDDDNVEPGDCDGNEMSNTVERDSLETKHELNRSAFANVSIKDSPSGKIVSIIQNLSCRLGSFPYIDQSYSEASKMERDCLDTSIVSETASAVEHHHQESSPKISISVHSQHTPTRSLPSFSLVTQQNHAAKASAMSEASKIERDCLETSIVSETVSTMEHHHQESSPKFSLLMSSQHSLTNSPPSLSLILQHQQQRQENASAMSGDLNAYSGASPDFLTVMNSEESKFVRPDEKVTASLLQSTRKTRQADSVKSVRATSQKKDLNFETPRPSFKTSSVVLSESSDENANHDEYEPTSSIKKQSSRARKTKQTSNRNKRAVEEDMDDDDDDDDSVKDMKENSSIRKSARKTQQPSGPATTGRRRRNLLKTDDTPLLNIPFEESLREDEPSPLSTLKRQLRSRKI